MSSINPSDHPTVDCKTYRKGEILEFQHLSFQEKSLYLGNGNYTLPLDNYYFSGIDNSFIKEKETMDTLVLYNGIVVDKRTPQVVLEDWIFARNGELAKSQLVLLLAKHLDTTGFDVEDYEFILAQRGTITRSTE